MQQLLQLFRRFYVELFTFWGLKNISFLWQCYGNGEMYLFADLESKKQRVLKTHSRLFETLFSVLRANRWNRFRNMVMLWTQLCAWQQLLLNFEHAKKFNNDGWMLYSKYSVENVFSVLFLCWMWSVNDQSQKSPGIFYNKL